MRIKGSLWRIPALLITTSGAPLAFANSSRQFSTALGSVISTENPATPDSLTTDSSRSLSRSMIETRAPRRHSSIAIALPRPEAPPVMIICLFFISIKLHRLVSGDKDFFYSRNRAHADNFFEGKLNAKILFDAGNKLHVLERVPCGYIVHRHIVADFFNGHFEDLVHQLFNVSSHSDHSLSLIFHSIRSYSFVISPTRDREFHISTSMIESPATNGPPP